MDDLLDRLLDAALPHVAFDGWSATSFAHALKDSGILVPTAQAVAPRGAVDLAVAYHRRADRAMAAAYAAEDVAALRYRDKVARLVRLRLDGVDPEIVRRGMALFALPQHAPEGLALLWGTADAIWQALGDRSEDINWYTKRMTLSAVFSSTVLFWLGDGSDGKQATWEFLDRRIEDVMRIEGFKARLREGPIYQRASESSLNPLKHIRKPHRAGG